MKRYDGRGVFWLPHSVVWRLCCTVTKNRLSFMLLKALELGKQYVAVSQKGCNEVRIEKEITISYLEQLFMKEVAEANRIKGSSMANDICRNYRRDGLFFDEILDQATGGNGKA